MNKYKIIQIKGPKIKEYIPKYRDKNGYLPINNEDYLSISNFLSNKSNHSENNIFDTDNPQINVNLNIQHEIINNYQKISSIGEGGFGKVFLVKNVTNNKFYAMKEINTNRERVVDYKKEIDILSKLKSEFTVSFVEGFINEKNGYIVMEYCRNGDLKRLLKIYQDNNVYLDTGVLLYINLDYIKIYNVIIKRFRFYSSTWLCTL